jgi:pimeloyl-ACP methyl ester carboxylesterase
MLPACVPRCTMRSMAHNVTLNRPIGYWRSCVLAAVAILFGVAAAADAQGISPWPIPLEDRFFISAGVKLRYVDVGRGEPIILVHGAGNSIEFPWRDRGIIGALAETHRVIAYDARGHGKSDNPKTPEEYSFQLMTADLAALLDHVGIAKAHVVGYSMGARSVVSLLLSRPQRFLTATIIASEWFFKWDHKEAALVNAELVDLAKNRTSVCVDANVTRECANVLRQMGLRLSRQASVIAPPRLNTITVPILGIVGTDDIDLLPMRELRSFKPSMTYLEVDGATHGGDNGILGRAETLALLKAFLTTNRQTK